MASRFGCVDGWHNTHTDRAGGPTDQSPLVAICNADGRKSLGAHGGVGQCSFHVGDREPLARRRRAFRDRVGSRRGRPLRGRGGRAALRAGARGVLRALLDGRPVDRSRSESARVQPGECAAARRRGDGLGGSRRAVSPRPSPWWRASGRSDPRTATASSPPPRAPRTAAAASPPRCATSSSATPSRRLTSTE